MAKFYIKKKTLTEWFVENIMKAQWIVNSNDELGIRVFGINLWYYKYSEPMISENGIGKEGKWRFAEKREFGEVIHSRIGFKYDRNN